MPNFDNYMLSSKNSLTEIEERLDAFREACARREDDLADALEEEILALAATLHMGNGPSLREASDRRNMVANMAIKLTRIRSKYWGR